MVKLYDISVMLGIESAVYPGDPVFTAEPFASMETGDPFRLTRISMGLHEGTHLDFPFHFIYGGKEAADYSVDRFILPARVVTVPGRRLIDRIPDVPLRSGEALLFRTDNSERGIPTGGRFVDDYSYLSIDIADQCVEKGVTLIGIDAFSVEDGNDPDFPVHHLLLENDILILENINLAGVPEGLYRLYCMPLRMAGVEASPVRAVLEAIIGNVQIL